MNSPLTVKPPYTFNHAYYGMGLSILFLNKIRHSIKGYTTPKPFPISDCAKSIEYDFHVVEQWMDILQIYSGDLANVKDKSVLELGPGSDLGVGLILLGKGAKKYNALDVNNLTKVIPQQFYEHFFAHIKAKTPDNKVGHAFLRAQLELTQRGRNDKLNYICRSDFDVSVFKGEQIDLVFSQAAFEHFDSVEKTISQLSNVVKRGAVIIAEIDLQTHTRWIREMDPLNIYRYSDLIYDVFRFRGSPNRLRPCDYTEILEKNGWEMIKIIPLTVLDNDYLTTVQKSLSKKFQHSMSQMHVLNFMLCATKI